MKERMYSVKDEHTGFTPAIPLANDEVAKRYFHEVMETSMTVKLAPKDFSIWYLGEFDRETGETKNDIKLIERG